MAAYYMRKTGILPVCTNNEARAYFAGKGLTYADVTEGDILTLVMLLPLRQQPLLRAPGVHQLQR